MFRNMPELEMVLILIRFLELRNLDIEEIRALGKECHSEFSEWLTMNEREELLKECLSRIV